MPTSSKGEKVVIIGVGGHGHVVRNILEHHLDAHIIALLDDDTTKEGVADSVSAFTRYINDARFIIAIGNNETRERIYTMLCNESALFINVIHPDALIEDDVRIGQGVMIGARTYLNTGAEIGDNTIINNGVIIEHHTRVGNHCHIAPRVVTGGDVIIEDTVWVGLGSTIRNEITIKARSFIGMGSNVVKDVEGDSVYYGNPARKISSRV